MKKPSYSSALCILNQDKEKHLAPINQCRKTKQSFIALITSAHLVHGIMNVNVNNNYESTLPVCLTVIMSCEINPAIHYAAVT